MNTILATLTMVALAVCGANNNTIVENLLVEKNINKNTSERIIYKKVPTKWVKTTKKSN